MKYLYSIFSIVIFLFISPLLIAQPDVQIKGHMIHAVQEKPAPGNAPYAMKKKPKQYVTLLDVALSEHAWQTLNKRAKTTVASKPRMLEQNQPHDLKTSVQLGMNAVPVLDQGMHGTCATFAITAALDAALNQGDYISQLCHLQLGETISENSYRPSGWDGSTIAYIFNQIDTFGIVDTATQKAVGCGGLNNYHDAPSTPLATMTVSEYHALSSPLPDEISATQLLTTEQIFKDFINPEDTLKAVKNALRHHDRLAFGTLLLGLNEGQVGATGKHHEINDTWLLTPEVLVSLLTHNNYGGHAMVITGFDDLATATDVHGQVHQGLLTLRNSWGSHAGDQGDFYMTYDYFKLLTLELIRIRSNNAIFN